MSRCCSRLQVDSKLVCVEGTPHHVMYNSSLCRIVVPLKSDAGDPKFFVRDSSLLGYIDHCASV